MRFELIDHARASRPEDTDKNVRVFQIGRDVHLIDGHQAFFKFHFARDNYTELAFQHFIYAQ